MSGMSMSRKSITRVNKLRSIKGRLATTFAWFGPVRFLLCVGLFLFMLNVSLFYPGLYSYDSNDQLCQVMGDCIYSSWHPVGMVLLWSLLVHVTGSIASFFIVQIILMWTTLTLFAIYLYRKTMNISLAVLALGIGLLPNIINLSGTVEKSVVLTWLIGLAVSVLLNIEFMKKYTSKVFAYLLVIVTLFYASSLRTGTFIATLPIFVWLLYVIASQLDDAVCRRVMMGVGSISIISSLFAPTILQTVTNQYQPVLSTSSSVTMYVLDIANLYSSSEIEQLTIRDHDLKVYLQDLSRSECSYGSGAKNIEVNVWLCAGSSQLKNLGSPEKIGEVKSVWKEAVMSRPFKYIAFKTDTYLGFLFPTSDNSKVIYVDSWKGADGTDYLAKYNTYPHKMTAHIVDQWASSFGYNYMPFLYAAWFWLALSLCGIIIVMKYFAQHQDLLYCVLALCTSAFLYIFSYAPGSLPPNYRYYYWSVLAVILSAFLLYAGRHFRQNTTSR